MINHLVFLFFPLSQKVTVDKDMGKKYYSLLFLTSCLVCLKVCIFLRTSLVDVYRHYWSYINLIWLISTEIGFQVSTLSILCSLHMLIYWSIYSNQGAEAQTANSG